MVGTILAIVIGLALLAWLGQYAPPSRGAHPFEHERYKAEVEKRRAKRIERGRKNYGKYYKP
jgi:hypothetical protein